MPVTWLRRPVRAAVSRSANRPRLARPVSGSCSGLVRQVLLGHLPAGDVDVRHHRPGHVPVQRRDAQQEPAVDRRGRAGILHLAVHRVPAQDGPQAVRGPLGVRAARRGGPGAQIEVVRRPPRWSPAGRRCPWRTSARPGSRPRSSPSGIHHCGRVGQRVQHGPGQPVAHHRGLRRTLHSTEQIVTTSSLLTRTARWWPRRCYRRRRRASRARGGRYRRCGGRRAAGRSAPSHPAATSLRVTAR